MNPANVHKLLWYLPQRDDPEFRKKQSEYLASYRNVDRYRKLTLKWQKEYARKNPQAIIARNALNHAVAAGKLVRPEECQQCKQIPARGRDGRSRIHAHHHLGYDHPLDVQWLCHDCHAKLSRIY